MNPNAYDKLTEQINQFFHDDPRLGVYALKARAYEDGVVQIQGIVDVLDEKYQAEELVKKVPGVKQVENNITVCTDGEIDDGAVRFEVGEEFQANLDIPDTVGFTVNGGEVQLVGSVANKREMDEAVETAAKARGVREIHSNLHLVAEYDDVTITNNVQAALLAEPLIIPGRVRALTESGIVTLWGNVPEEIAVTAMEIAARVPGVRQVNNGFNGDLVELNDETVAQMMKQLAANSFLRQLPINIEIGDDRITLLGRVADAGERRQAETVILKILGNFHLPGYTLENRLRLAGEEN